MTGGAASAADAAIEVHGLTRVFRGGGGAPVVANCNLSFTVARGQVFGLLGANGSGKTTLVSQLLGLVRPTSGSIRVAGLDVVANPDMVKTVSGFLPQSAVPMRSVEVHRALYFTGRLRGQPRADARRQTDEVLDELELAPVAGRHVNALSGGLVRLVNVGMSLMGRPELLVLDEPTNELDPQNRRLVWDAVARRSTAEGTTVVLVTHNVLEADRAVDQVAVMHRGRITAMGTPGELKRLLDDRVRTELFVPGGGGLPAEDLALLASFGEVVTGERPGSYLVRADADRVPGLVQLLTAEIGSGRIDDFRITRPTLEDVYVGLNQAAQAAAGPGPVACPAPAPPSAPAGGPAPPQSGSGPADDASGAVDASGPGLVDGPGPGLVDGPGPGSGPGPGPGGGPGPVAASGPGLVDASGPVDASGTGPAAEPVPGRVAVARPAALPRPARRRGRTRRMLTGLKYLWLEQMLEVRSTWSWTVLFGFLMPAAMVFGLTKVGNGLSDQRSMLYIASGAAVFSVATEGIATLAQRVGVMKRDNMMVYYASLPICRASLLSAMVLSRMVLVLPGLVTPIVVANQLYGADFALSPALLLVLPLTCLSLSAIGLAIGMLIDDLELIVVVTNLLIFVLLLAAPVFIPAEVLPLPLRVLGQLLPPTHAADALRRALTGDLGGAFLLDVAVLAVMAVLGLLAATRWIRWRTA